MEEEGIASRCGLLVYRLDYIIYQWSGVYVPFVKLFAGRNQKFPVFVVFVVLDILIKVSTVFVEAVHELSAHGTQHRQST